MCGVFGVYDQEEASKIAYYGLYALQHRGQESAGISTLNNHQIRTHKGLGLVSEVFNEKTLAPLEGRSCIGHVRYSTTGQNMIMNAQPFAADFGSYGISLAHNGNLVNAMKIKMQMQEQGSIFHASSDTEVILHLLARQSEGSWFDKIERTCRMLKGAYSLVILAGQSLWAVRDPHGFRPLVLGRMRNEKDQLVPVIASETSAFDLIGAEFEREIAPGEIFCVGPEGEMSRSMNQEVFSTAKCVFEHVYFARPDSVVFGQSVYETRKMIGRVLALETPVDADIVVPVPDSGVAAAMGYAEESRLPYELGIIRNHYVGRTFINPTQSIRSLGVKIKLNPQRAVIAGKKVVVVDDSVVRGTTSRQIVQMLRQAGAKEIHFRVASPPTTGPCYYGVDTPQKADLIASRLSTDEIKKYLEVDSLAYLSMPGLLKVVRSGASGPQKTFCAACFDGQYPTEISN